MSIWFKLVCPSNTPVRRIFGDPSIKPEGDYAFFCQYKCADFEEALLITRLRLKDPYIYESAIIPGLQQVRYIPVDYGWRVIWKYTSEPLTWRHC